MSASRRRRPFQEFVTTEAAGGIALLAAALAAMVAANSALADAYHTLWATPIALGPSTHPLTLSARGWVNDGLMAVFFLLVGLEIKREVLVGELSSWRQAALPFAAALGGIVAPAALFLGLAPAVARAGWAIPTATDIAFALGVLALVAPRAPAGLKVFLAALAIVDDMSAVLLIALVYTATLHVGALLASAAILVALFGLNRTGVRSLSPYLTLGLALWFFVHESGVHATIAGVLLAFTIPTRTRVNALEFSREARAHLDEFDRTETGDLLVLTSRGQQEALHALDAASRSVAAPLLRLEHARHRPTAFLVMPIFAFANAGVTLAPTTADAATTLAVALGLVVGKPVGITLTSWAAVRAGIASLPADVNWSMIHGAAWVAGIGFTMSLFIAGLAYGESAVYRAAQVGIIAGSTLAALGGAVILRRTQRR